MATTYPTRTTSAERGSFMTEGGPGVVGGPRSGARGELVGHDLHGGVEASDAAVAALVGQRVVRGRHLGSRFARQLVQLRAQQVEVPRREALQAVRAEQDEPLRDLVR